MQSFSETLLFPKKIWDKGGELSKLVFDNDYRWFKV